MNSITDNDDGQIEFFVAGSQEYIDFGNTRLRLKFKIINENGDDQKADSKCTVINNILHSLFSHIHVVFNNVCVTQRSGYYHYRAYIEKLCNYGLSAYNSHLRTCLFIKDTSGKFSASAENFGYNVRFKVTLRHEVDVEGVFSESYCILSLQMFSYLQYNYCM